MPALLIEFPDTDGRPVFFDPHLVIAIREDIDKTHNVRTSLVTLGQPGGTSTVLRVREGASLVGHRVNLARRGLLERIDAEVTRLRTEKADVGESLAREFERKEGAVE